MTLQQWSYVGMLAFCLVGTLPLIPAFRLRVMRQPKRVALTILAAGTPFLVWDLLATRAGHWSFDEDQTLPFRVAGIPVEEVSFFVVIPLVTILTYEAVKVVRKKAVAPTRERRGVR